MVMRVLIMAGGTGGHVFPALAVAERLRDQGVEVVWMGTRQGLEADIVPRAGFSMEWVSVAGLRGKGLMSWLLAPLRLGRALLQVLVILLRCRPMAVLGMGGFVSGPGGLMAWLLKRPLLIHEQNAVAGLTNRLLARLADRVMQAFPRALPERFHPQLTGNPVRKEIAALAMPEQRFAGRQDGLRLLVLGGSLGAQALNEVVPQMLASLSVTRSIQVWHQAGQRNLEAAQTAYSESVGDSERRHDIKLVPFIEDMAAAYGWADLVLCRAGALTVAELAAAGVAAILVPYPHAVDDHQTHNAAWLADAGAAILVPQSQLTPAWLVDQLNQLWPEAHNDAGQGAGIVSERQLLLKMAQQARALARMDAAEQVAQACMEVAHG
jgi:UDP-N-acetylglucosamine--N-acetylmuramyl-(pentapeptide) pyrophosphoryl-undecaprenol N-acetylglucosamine transferase